VLTFTHGFRTVIIIENTILASVTIFAADSVAVAIRKNIKPKCRRSDFGKSRPRTSPGEAVFGFRVAAPVTFWPPRPRN